MNQEELITLLKQSGSGPGMYGTSMHYFIPLYQHTNQAVRSNICSIHVEMNQALQNGMSVGIPGFDHC